MPQHAPPESTTSALATARENWIAALTAAAQLDAEVKPSRGVALQGYLARRQMVNAAVGGTYQRWKAVELPAHQALRQYHIAQSQLARGTVAAQHQQTARMAEAFQVLTGLVEPGLSENETIQRVEALLLPPIINGKVVNDAIIG